MRRLRVVSMVVGLLAATMLAPTTSLAQTAKQLRQHIEDAGCVVTALSCGQALDGALAPGDCISTANGAFEDFYEFDGVAGQVADLRVFPLDATMTKPIAFLLPPKGDASDTPVAIGGNGIWTDYVFASTGKWSVVVSSSNLFASGRYKLALGCAPDGEPNLPQSCITQELVCGQTIAWSLSSQSCGFRDAPNRLYGQYEVYAVSGDVLSFRETSTAFNPLFGVYDSASNLLASSLRSGNTASVFFAVPSTGFYYFNATSELDLSVGGYSVSMDCNSGTSGCIPPVIADDPSDQQVIAGQSARLTALAASVGALKYSWYDISTGLPSFITQTDTGSLTINSVGHSMLIYVIATNPCGQAISRIATISPITRHRAAHH
jgi:hypothetical protein